MPRATHTKSIYPLSTPELERCAFDTIKNFEFVFFLLLLLFVCWKFHRTFSDDKLSYTSLEKCVRMVLTSRHIGNKMGNIERR